MIIVIKRYCQCKNKLKHTVVSVRRKNGGEAQASMAFY